MPVEVNDRLEVIFYARWEGQNGLCVRHYICSATSGASRTVAQLATALSTAMAPAFKQCLNEFATFLGLSVQKIGALAEEKEFELGDAGAGGTEGDGLPSQCCGLISLRTGLASRSRRGRMYVPFPGESANNPNGLPSDAYKLDMASLRNALVVGRTISDGSGNDCSILPVIYSRVLNSTAVIGSGIVRSTWATQKRRGQNAPGDELPTP